MRKKTIDDKCEHIGIYFGKDICYKIKKCEYQTKKVYLRDLRTNESKFRYLCGRYKEEKYEIYR